MPRVPYDPTKRVIRAQKQPRINASGAINAIGREAEANQQLAGTVSKLVRGIYEDKRERDNFADRRRLDSKIQEADDKLLAGIKAIEIKDGVDFQTEVDSLVGEFEQSLSDWVETPGNVRHGAFQREFAGRVHEVVEKAKADGRTKVDELDSSRNIGAAKKAIDLGIRMGNPEQIEKGVLLLNAEKVNGYASADEADLMYDSYIKKMHEVQDKDREALFEIATRAGDWEEAEKIVQSMEGEGWSEDRKQNYFEEKRRGAIKAGIKEAIQGVALSGGGLADLDALGKRIDTSKYLSDEDRSNLKYLANRERIKIEASQINNEAKFIEKFKKGEGDILDVEAAFELDNAKGLPAGSRERLKPILEEKQKGYDAEVRYVDDKKSPAFLDDVRSIGGSTFWQNQ